MDVTSTRFDGNLLPILEAISESLFVAIDLEFSGIPDRPAANRGTQRIETRYQELRIAAKRYQTLQVGLTCCSVKDVDSVDDSGSDSSSTGTWDRDGPSIDNTDINAPKNNNTDVNDPRNNNTGANTPKPPQKYTLTTYNFTLNPYIDEKLDITRQYVCDSAAMDFLVRSGFEITRSYQTGLKYLSPAEERAAKSKFKERLNRIFDDIVIGENDVETRQFLEGVRGKVDGWMRVEQGLGRVLITSRFPAQRNTISVDSIEIVDDDGHDDGPGLTNFDKRLIHQLIRKEYPSLVSIGRDNHMVIKAKDPMREAEIQQAKKDGFHRDVLRQRGFSWIVRALLGHDLSDIEIKTFGRDPVTGESRVYIAGPLQARFDRVQHWLAIRQPVLVGHNMFVDLVYFYQHFVDELPETLDEFLSIIHELSPMIVDTKFLATHDCGNTVPMSGLSEIEESMRWMREPVIEMATGFDKYVDREVKHEAGYDSLLTARTIIQLASLLGREFGSEDSAEANSESVFVPIETGSREAADKSHHSLAVPSFSDEAFWSRFGNRLRVFGTVEKVVDLSIAVPRPKSPDEDREIQW